MIDGDGRHLGRIWLFRDVTDHRRLERQFLQAQKMEVVGRLAGGVAHDFNNDLTVISTYAELVLEGLDAHDPRRADLEEIRRATERANRLTRQLLAFSRQDVVSPQLVAIEERVEGMLPVLRRVIGDDIAVAAELRGRPSVVLIDPRQLEHAVINLAVNARDAMPAGGRITIRTGVVDVAELPQRPGGRYCTLAVADTGTGLDEATRSRIFEPFFTTKAEDKGTGLGLATVLSIVQGAGGFIDVESTPGHGATFTMYLPHQESAAPEPARPHGPVKFDARRGTERVLVVDDNAFVRGAIQRTLGDFGYTVLVAASGKEALALVAESAEPIHLLVTDVVMPDIAGPELAEQIHTLRPEVKILYTSGYVDDPLARRLMGRPQAAFLPKPFSPETLGECVREVLDW